MNFRASEKEIAERKKAREMAKKLEERNKQESKIFREKMEGRIDEFLKLPIGEEKNRRLVMEPMAKYVCIFPIQKMDFTLKVFFLIFRYHRSVVHDVAEVAGLIAHSFGEEDVDRHCVLWRKEFAPCEDELDAHRNGIEWDPVASGKLYYF